MAGANNIGALTSRVGHNYKINRFCFNVKQFQHILATKKQGISMQILNNAQKNNHFMKIVALNK